MIVQPSFCEHWKTLRLVALTKDESSPMAVVRLWTHCQNSRRWVFPAMTPGQLASICRWGERKPACHVALLKAGFLDKLPGGGFTAHQWGEHNAQLVQKWTARQVGEQKRSGAKPNESTPPAKSDDHRTIAADALDEKGLDEKGFDRSGQDLKRLNDAVGDSQPVGETGPERSSLNRSQEEALMGNLRELLGEDEMARAGGHWRDNHVRKHPELLFRVLAELERALKEGEAIRNRAAYCEDLLKRWKA